MQTFSFPITKEVKSMDVKMDKKRTETILPIHTNFLTMISIKSIILLLRQDVYPYKYMNNLEKISET